MVNTRSVVFHTVPFVLVAMFSFYIGQQSFVLSPSIAATLAESQLCDEFESTTIVDPSTTPTTPTTPTTSTTTPTTTVTVPPLRPRNYLQEALDAVNETIANLISEVSLAHKYVRSGKAMYELTVAFETLVQLATGVSHPIAKSASLEPNIFRYPKVKSEQQGREICPEIWMGMEYGYPFYYEGFVIDKNCTYGLPIESLLTLVLNLVPNFNADALTRILNGVQELHPNLTLIIGVRESAANAVRWIASDYQNLSIVVVSFFDERRTGIWYDLVKAVKTKYVLIGRDLIHFDENSRIERLMRLIDFTNVDIAAGSHRNWSGHWMLGCYQMKMQNFHVRIVEGYDLSYNSCIYCDYASGPFVAKRDVIQKLLDSDLDDDILFLDVFSQLQQKNRTVILCADAMYFTERVAPFDHVAHASWILYAQGWLLHAITFPDNRVVEFKCSQVTLQCNKRQGMLLSPCCLKELEDMLKFVVEVCRQHNLSCEIATGTLTGAVKFQGLLPWERDADIDYHTHNHSVLLRLADLFEQAGYKLTEVKKPENCPDATDVSNVNCGELELRSSRNWRIQMYGCTRMASAPLTEINMPSTKVLVEGMWMSGYPNPGAFARNLYGDDIFEHVEHWYTLGYSTGWKPYVTGAWMNCAEPGLPACLPVHFLPVGNLQFNQIWM